MCYFLQLIFFRMETEIPSDIPVGQVEAVTAGRPAGKLGGDRAATVPSPAPGKTPVAPSLPIITPVSAAAPLSGSPGNYCTNIFLLIKTKAQNSLLVQITSLP